MRYIIVTGDPISGFTFIGPFDDINEAIEYAGEHLSSEMYYTASLEEPLDA